MNYCSNSCLPFFLLCINASICTSFISLPLTERFFPNFLPKHISLMRKIKLLILATQAYSSHSISGSNAKKINFIQVYEILLPFSTLKYHAQLYKCSKFGMQDRKSVRIIQLPSTCSISIHDLSHVLTIIPFMSCY